MAMRLCGAIAPLTYLNVWMYTLFAEIEEYAFVLENIFVYMHFIW